MQSAWHGQHELLNGDSKWLTIITNSEVCATHRTDGRLQRTATRVLETLAWTKQWLLSHDPQPFDILPLVVTVHDNPVATDHLCRALSCIGYPDTVGKNISLLARIRLVRHVLRLDFHFQFKRLHVGTPSHSF